MKIFDIIIENNVEIDGINRKRQAVEWKEYRKVRFYLKFYKAKFMRL